MGDGHYVLRSMSHPPFELLRDVADAEDWLDHQQAARPCSKLDLTFISPRNPPYRNPSRRRQNKRDRLETSSIISADATRSSHVTLTAQNALVSVVRERIAPAHGDPPTFANAIDPDRKCPSQTASMPGRRLLLIMSTEIG